LNAPLINANRLIEENLAKSKLRLGRSRAVRLPLLENLPAVSYGAPWAHYLGGYQDRLLGGPLGLPGLCHMAPDGVRRKDYGGEVLG
jgi:hypothetical protein